MDLVIQQPLKSSTSQHKNLLLWALIASFILHLVLVFILPNIQFSIEKKPETLTIELVATKPQPIPTPVLQPLEPVKKVTPIQPKPVTKLITQASPINEPPVVREPTVITAAPKPELPATFTAPPTPPAPTPEPPKVVVAQEDINSAKSAYIASIQKELQRNHRYPKMAERNGIQGIAKVEIRLDKQGNIISANIIESSGSTVLDDGALATVKRSNLRQYMKEILYGHLDTVVVPIAFTLAPN